MTNNGWIAGANAPAEGMYTGQTLISNVRFIGSAEAELDSAQARGQLA